MAESTADQPGLDGIQEVSEGSKKVICSGTFSIAGEI